MIYEILEAETTQELVLKVNQKLADGWELYGQLVTAIKPDTSEIRGGIGFTVESKVILFQPVIKITSEKE
jgi:hypothetical protein